MNQELNCSACHRRVAVSDMKYSRDGSGLICDQCSMKQGSGVKLKIKSSTFTKSVDFVAKKKITYICTSCNYKYDRVAGFRGPRICPNCSKRQVIYDLPKDANELMKELDKLDI